jgi:hypothetical protein
MNAAHRFWPRLLFAAVLLLSALPARADMGPCKPDTFKGLTCGTGINAARVIADTLSPDKRFAFAWRSPGAEPTDQPDSTDTIDLLLVRLADGAILAKAETQYWDTGETHANRLLEQVSWSPDNRIAVRTLRQRFDTGSFDVFALRSDATAADTVDLLKIVEPALRARLEKKIGDTEAYVLSVQGGKKLKINNAGVIQAAVSLWHPKEGPEEAYAVTLRISHGKDGVGANILAAKIERVAKGAKRIFP